MHRRTAAFTLLEMMVVLAIAALIIAIGAGAMQNVTEENELRKASQSLEGIFMTAVHRAYATTSAQAVTFDEQGVTLQGARPQAAAGNPSVILPKGTRLQLRRMGSDRFVPAAGQRVLMLPGGLCEPLQFQLQWQGTTLSASLDALTGGFTDVEESVQP
jgi:type II secretion system protein H